MFEVGAPTYSFSALQRAEIAEIFTVSEVKIRYSCFSALQRAEIAEIKLWIERSVIPALVSVLFNEPKLLKWETVR